MPIVPGVEKRDALALRTFFTTQLAQMRAGVRVGMRWGNWLRAGGRLSPRRPFWSSGTTTPAAADTPLGDGRSYQLSYDAGPSVGQACLLDVL